MIFFPFLECHTKIQTKSLVVQFQMDHSWQIFEHCSANVNVLMEVTRHSTFSGKLQEYTDDVHYQKQACIAMETFEIDSKLHHLTTPLTNAKIHLLLACK